MRKQSVAGLQQGFTLIELMAVLVIIGMAVSLMTISVGDGNRGQKIKQQSRALYKSIELAIEEASFNQVELGIRFDPYFEEGNSNQYQYRWLIFDHKERQWFLLESEELQKTVLMPEIDLEIEVEGNPVLIGEEKDSDEALFALNDEKLGQGPLIEPDIYFLSSGEMPDFTIRINDSQRDNYSADELSSFRIKGNFIGQLTYFLPGQEDDES
jgi:general secretion pathway protein H